jgi:hypothetical protein
MSSEAASHVEHIDADGVVTYESVPVPSPAVEQILAATEVSLRKRARVALKSGYLPTSVYTEEQVLMIVRAGEELGLPFMASLRSISLVEGKIALEATLMRALALRKIKGSKIVFHECTAQRCVVEMSRPSAAIMVTYAIEDAQRAELTKKANWRRHPISMLIARASAIGCRAIFADALLGGSVYDPDELDRSGDAMSEQDVEIERYKQEIEALAVALPEEKREACLRQTRDATLTNNVTLLQKIRDRVKSLVDPQDPPEEPTKTPETPETPETEVVTVLSGGAIAEETKSTQEEIGSS